MPSGHFSLFYLHGFASGPDSSKGQFFRQRFAELGYELQLPDLTEGDFENTTLSRQLALLDRVVGASPAVLIGSSMGAYLAALFAARHPRRVPGVVLLAPAFDLGRYWAASLGEDVVREWRERGQRQVYHFGEKQIRNLSYRLLEDALQYEGFPDVRQPALVVHGRADETVDHRLSLRFAEDRSNAEVVLYDSDHQLLNVLDEIWERVRKFTAEIPEASSQGLRFRPFPTKSRRQ